MNTARVSCLTPAGLGAIAVVRIEGPAAGATLDRVLVGRRRASELPIGQVLLFRLGDPSGEEVVVARLGERLWELGCHGGAASVEAAVARLEAAGAIRAPWTEALRSECEDRLTAEARIDLASATTLRTAAILLDQAQGALRRAVDQVVARLAAGQAAAAVETLDELLRFAPLGLHQTRPWRVVLLGPPNVGKSSLLNSLAGYERALTHAEPGTTRDVVTLTTAFDGWPVELADTAGQRDADDPLESAGARLGRAAAAAGDLVLLVADRSKPWSGADRALAREFPAALLVHNKCDLPPAGDIAERPVGVSVSAKSGEGLPALVTALLRAVLPAAPPPGAAVPFRVEQVAALRDAREQLTAGHVGAARRELAALVAS